METISQNSVVVGDHNQYASRTSSCLSAKGRIFRLLHPISVHRKDLIARGTNWMRAASMSLPVALLLLTSPPSLHTLPWCLCGSSSVSFVEDVVLWSVSGQVDTAARAADRPTNSQFPVPGFSKPQRDHAGCLGHCGWRKKGT